MMWVVCRISIQRLLNNRQELLVTFLVPLLFFTIFALIFSRGVGQPATRVRVAFVDDDRTPESQRLVQQACQQPELQALPSIIRTNSKWPISELSKLLLSQHRVEVVVHIPRGFTTQDPESPTLSIGLFDEGSNPIGPRLVEASLAESIAMELSRSNLESSGVTTASQPTQNASLAVHRPSVQQPTIQQLTVQQLTVQQPTANPLTSNQLVSQVKPASYRSEPITDSKPASDSSSNVLSNSSSVQRVFESISPFHSSKHQPKIALYAAGIAVMFLLFSAGSAGASLLDEREHGTLGRMLCSRLTIAELLAGKWLYLTGLGFLQTTLMFAWGQLAFQVDLLGHLPGFLIMTLFTSAVCASFGLALATACRSREQLTAVSMVVILSMSAVGGSMVPRYVMSDTMKSLGKLTFNGWALDGYQKIFWYDLPTRSLTTEVAVLAMITAILSVVSYLLAQRWKLA